MSSLHRSSASTHDMLIFWSSCTTVLRQELLDLSSFLLSGGVHLQATLGIRSCSILYTRQSHLNRLNVMSLVMLWLLVFLYSCSLDILLGQKIWHILLRHLWWKTSSVCTDHSPTLWSLNHRGEQTWHCCYTGASLFWAVLCVDGVYVHHLSFGGVDVKLAPVWHICWSCHLDCILEWFVERRARLSAKSIN